jgi:hypothetical protein
MENNKPATVTPAMSAPARFWNIFWDPKAVFESLAAKPSWIMPWILLTVVSIASAQFTWKYIMEDQLERLASRPGMTEEQMDQAERMIGDPEGWGTQRIIAVVMTPVGILISFVVVAGVLYLVGAVIGGGSSTYKQNLAVFSHASLVGVLGAIVGTILVSIRHSVDVNLSLALFLPPETAESFIYKFFSKIEFFSVWIYIVTSIGISIVNRFSAAKAFISVGALWLIWILLSVSLQNLFGGFMG